MTILMLINAISLISIMFSACFLLLHPKIKLPIFVDILFLLGLIGALAVFINSVLSFNLYGYTRNADLWFRAVWAAIVVTGTYYLYNRSVGNSEL